MPIPLLSFPSDLLRDLFKECDPFDLYKLSQCSKRTRKSIMTNTSTNNWKIRGNDKKIFVLCEKSRYCFIKTTMPNAYEYAKQYPFFDLCMEPVKGMFIQYPNGGFPELFVHLLDTLRIRTVNELISPNETAPSCSFERYLELMRSVIERNLDVERLYCNTKGDECAIATFMELSNQINVTKAFHCDQPFPPGFQHHFTRFPEQIFLRDSHWFQLDQLISCSCTHIELEESTLSNQDIDLLLRKWKKNEALPNLQSLGISTKNVDNKSSILGMIPPINGNGNPRRYIRVENADKEVIDPVQVTKDDGTVGWLKVELGIRPIIKLLIVNSSSSVREIIRRSPIFESDTEEESEDEEGASDAS
ncbi:hypothetical protein B9Z55_027146 [Caenorhabditis nigoni]|uniref:F-box domain-containing protein n=1 Tax=Caenorhabditis nigoni TaxID=1611254 RepID=A0A2G5SGE9_9PELO|nr:hypothetical protein B9Z55_027146 [Caenorhabditis nigoni]